MFSIYFWFSLCRVYTVHVQSLGSRLIAEIGLIAESVSIKHGLRTADYGLRTGYKIRTRYKTRTGKYGLGIKHGLGIKRGLENTDWV